MADLNLKQHDTKPFVAHLKYQDGESFNLSDVKSIRFIMKLSTNGQLRVNSEAEIVESSAGRVRYAWKSGDTSKVGDFNAEFHLVFDDGSVLTVPSENYIEISIEPRLV